MASCHIAQIQCLLLQSLLSFSTVTAYCTTMDSYAMDLQKKMHMDI